MPTMVLASCWGDHGKKCGTVNRTSPKWSRFWAAVRCDCECHKWPNDPDRWPLTTAQLIRKYQWIQRERERESG